MPLVWPSGEAVVNDGSSNKADFQVVAREGIQFKEYLVLPVR